MLSPKRTKYRKMQKGNVRGLAYVGKRRLLRRLRSAGLEPARVTLAQIEAARMAIQRHVQARRQALDPGLPGSPGHQEAPRSPHGWRKGRSGRVGRGVKPGRVMYEIAGVTEEMAREAFRLAAHKLPMQCKFLARGIV
jgi:large subunit ribosomal protein L16